LGDLSLEVEALGFGGAMGSGFGGAAVGDGTKNEVMVGKELKFFG
jgi:hypothetical protein